jgi:hypothetical protein
MSTADNIALIRRFYEEVWNKGNVDVALQVFAVRLRRNRRAAASPDTPLQSERCA